MSPLKWHTAREEKRFWHGHSIEEMKSQSFMLTMISNLSTKLSFKGYEILRRYLIRNRLRAVYYSFTSANTKPRALFNVMLNPRVALSFASRSFRTTNIVANYNNDLARITLALQETKNH